MKKLTIIIAALSLTAAISSCRKDYVCKCSKTYTYSTSSETIDDGQYTYKDTKARAVSRCNANESTGSDIKGNYTRNCAIQ